MLIVSACLLGLNTNYKQGHSFCPQLIPLLQKGLLLPVCPEQLGGLPTPRPPAEIQQGNGYDVLAGRARVKTNIGCDVTRNFVQGAEETLRLAQLANASVAILKARSPSCGKNYIYDGSYKGIIVPGAGVTAALLLQCGIVVYSNEEIDRQLLKKLYAN